MSRIHSSDCLIANKFGLDVSASAAILHWLRVALESPGLDQLHERVKIPPKAAPTTTTTPTPKSNTT